jgi:hypothetical protein
VIRAPASSVAVLEKRGLEELTGTIRTLFSVLALEVLEATRAWEIVIDGHRSGLLRVVTSRRGRGGWAGLVENSAEFEFLGRDALIERDLFAEFLGTLAEAAEFLLLLFVFGDVAFSVLNVSGLVALLLDALFVLFGHFVVRVFGTIVGTLVLHSAHFGEDSSEFVEERLDLGGGFHVLFASLRGVLITAAVATELNLRRKKERPEESQKKKSCVTQLLLFAKIALPQRQSVPESRKKCISGIELDACRMTCSYE